MTDTAPAITEVDGYLTGPVRRPVNLAAQSKGSIHDDATAQKLGFRGGTVAGSIHMDQFPPILLQAFGPAWFETGSLSMQFRNATTGGEPVIASVQRPASDATDATVAVRMVRDDGMLVGEGTASVGSPAQPSHLFQLDLRPSPPDELRLLTGVHAGDATSAFEGAVDGAAIRGRIDRGGVTEPLAWYTGPSPWGGPVASPQGLVQLLYARSTGTFRAAGAVGLFGAIEVRHHAGPVFLDRTYQVSGTVAAVGASPKTEYVWFDTAATDPDSGTVVASMRMQLRWMKASSDRYS